MLTAMFFVRDLDRMATFYGDGFGLTVDSPQTRPGYRCLAADGVRIALHDVADGTVDDSTEPRTGVPVKMLIAVPDVDSTRQRLERLGGRLVASADDAYDVADPEGNIVRVHHAG